LDQVNLRDSENIGIANITAGFDQIKSLISLRGFLEKFEQLVGIRELANDKLANTE